MNITRVYQTLGLPMAALLIFGIGNARAESSRSDRVVDACRHILSAANESHYQHSSHVDEAAGVYDVDCSGLLCYVIVWRKAELIPGKDTGHVMIIDEPPVADGQGLYRVTLIDSTESPHADDTRKDGATGVGRGTMWFLVDADGHPTGYHWRLRNGKSRDIEIAIGRAIEAP